MQRHPPGPSDTDPRARRVWMDLLRAKTPGERIAIAFELTDFTLRMAESDVRARYTNACEREIFLRCADLRPPRDLMIRAYNWDPQENGAERGVAGMFNTCAHGRETQVSANS